MESCLHDGDFGVCLDKPSKKITNYDYYGANSINCETCIALVIVLNDHNDQNSSCFALECGLPVLLSLREIHLFELLSVADKSTLTARKAKHTLVSIHLVCVTSLLGFLLNCSKVRSKIELCIGHVAGFTLSA